MNRFELAENTLSKSAPSRVIYATASVGRPDGGVPVIRRSDTACGLITGGGPNKCGGVEECLGNDRHGLAVLGPGPCHGRPAPGGRLPPRDVVLARHHGRARGHRGSGAASGQGVGPAGRSGRCVLVHISGDRRLATEQWLLSALPASSHDRARIEWQEHGGGAATPRAAATPAPAVQGPAATAGSGAHENARPGGRKPPGRAFSRSTGPAFS